MSDHGTAIAKADTPPPPIVPDRPPTALLASSGVMEQITAIAKMAVAGGSDMIPASIKTPAQAAAIMLAGFELGLRPFTALRHVYIVGGKTEIETRAMVGIVRARDPRIRFEWPEYTREAVTCVLTRPGQQPVTVRYTIQDANASGQTRKKKKWIDDPDNKGRKKQIEVNGPWALYPRDMLYAAATKRACRLGAPDLINAIEGVAAPYDIMEAEYMVRDVTPPSAIDQVPPHPDYNPGDEPGAPLAAEVEDAVDDAEWRSLGDQADEAPVDDQAARREAQHATAAPAAAPDHADAPLLKEAKRLWAEVGKFSPANVAQVRAQVKEICAEETGAGNVAWSRFSAEQLTAACAAMQAFLAKGPDGARQGALG